MARKLASGHHRALTLTDEDASIYGLALEALKETDKRLDVVCAEYVQAVKELHGLATIVEAAQFYYAKQGAVVSCLVPKVVAELLEKNNKRSIQYQRELRLCLGKFAQSFAGYIHTVTHKEITKWLSDLEVAPRTTNNFRSLIITLFRFAQKQGYLPPGEIEAEKVEETHTTGDQGEIGIIAPGELMRCYERQGN